MNIKSGLKAIFREDEVEADWYKDRIEKCLKCEFNTLNGAKIEKVKDKIAHETLELLRPVINGEKEYSGSCSLCLCPINKKVGDKLESCPINKFEALASVSKGLEIISESGVEAVFTEEILTEIDTKKGKEKILVENLVIHLGDIKKNSIHKFCIKTALGGKLLSGAHFNCNCAMVDGLIKRGTKGYFEIPSVISTTTKPRKDDQSVLMILDYNNTRTGVKIKFNVK